MTINAISAACTLPQDAARTLCKLIADDRAVVAVMSAFSLAVVIGLAALAVEYGHGLLQRSDNQRAADLAAYGGALVYSTVLSSSGSNAAATMSAESAAMNIAALNGFAGVGVNVTPAVVASPRGDRNQSLQVTVTTRLPLYLARVLAADTTLPVTATAFAEIIPAAPGSGTGKPTVALVE